MSVGHLFWDPAGRLWLTLQDTTVSPGIALLSIGWSEHGTGWAEVKRAQFAIFALPVQLGPKQRAAMWTPVPFSDPKSPSAPIRSTYYPHTKLAPCRCHRTDDADDAYLYDLTSVRVCGRCAGRREQETAPSRSLLRSGHVS